MYKLPLYPGERKSSIKSHKLNPGGALPSSRTTNIWWVSTISESNNILPLVLRAIGLPPHIEMGELRLPYFYLEEKYAFLEKIALQIW